MVKEHKRPAQSDRGGHYRGRGGRGRGRFD